MRIYAVMKHSAQVISLCLLPVFLFGYVGRAQEKLIVFDYASQPEEFVVKLKPNRNYTIVRGSERFPFSLTLSGGTFGDNGTSRLIWNKIDRKAGLLRAKERIPYLVCAGGKDFLYIYGEKYGDLNFIELSDTNSVRGSDHATLQFYEEPKDPNNLPVRIGISALGPAAAEVSYRVGKLGRPVPNDPNGYLYCAPGYTQQKFVTEKECRVEVFASGEAQEGKEETLPAGSVFTRLRCNRNGDTDLLLEDGRVFRVKEYYLFSEPSAILEVVDLAGTRFAYKKAD